MGICYNEFFNKINIIGVCYEMYKDDLKQLNLNEIHMVKTLEESNRKLEEISDNLTSRCIWYIIQNL